MLQGMEQFILSALQALIYRERILNICYAMFVVMKEPSPSPGITSSRRAVSIPSLWQLTGKLLDTSSNIHNCNWLTQVLTFQSLQLKSPGLNRHLCYDNWQLAFTLLLSWQPAGRGLLEILTFKPITNYMLEYVGPIQLLILFFSSRPLGHLQYIKIWHDNSGIRYILFFCRTNKSEGFLDLYRRYYG